MLHKAWNSKGEMPYRFPRSSIKFQGHTGQNITDFDPNWAFPDYRPVAAFKSLRFALFKVIRQISRSHGSKNHRIWPKLGVSGQQLQFEFTDGYEMLHKAWNSKERCPIVFQGHPSNFKVTRDKTSPILTQIGRFRIIGRSQLSNPSDLPCFFKVVTPGFGQNNHFLWWLTFFFCCVSIVCSPLSIILDGGLRFSVSKLSKSVTSKLRAVCRLNQWLSARLQ